VPGKVDWLARALPVEGELAGARTAAKLARTDVVTCALDSRAGDVREQVARSPYGFALVVHDDAIVLGRLRMSAMQDAAADATAEQIMSPGPSTVRADTGAEELAKKLDSKSLKTAVVTDPEGRLIGVVLRRDLAAGS
jgi:CBS-domain-containing membrane protein